MRTDFLKEALSKASTTKVFLNEEGALKELPSIIKEYFGKVAVIIIADENTWQAAGKESYRYLK